MSLGALLDHRGDALIATEEGLRGLTAGSAHGLHAWRVARIEGAASAITSSTEADAIGSTLMT